MLHKSPRPTTGFGRNGVARKWQSILPVVASMIDARQASHRSAPTSIAQQRALNEPRFATQVLRTFIVDDSRVIQGTLKTALEDLVPVTVVGTAGDELAAADWLAAHAGECDLILLDICLRVGTGFGVLEQKAFKAFRGKCVVFTNHASPELEKRCKTLGADAVLSKSTGFGALLSYCDELARDERAKDSFRYSIKPFFSA